jgi:effector-binding domain-containing protein
MTTPRIVTRAAQPYAFLARPLTMQTMAVTGDMLGELMAWVARHGVARVGAPFVRYVVIDMASTLQIEAGVPVEASVTGGDGVRIGTLPAGRYVSTVYVGHPEGLVAPTGALLDWAAGQGLRWDVTAGPGGEHWGARLEVFHTDPAEQPDMRQWEIELLFKLAD